MAYFNGKKILNAKVELVRDNYDEGYRAGKAAGYAEGMEHGLEAGKEVERNAFWDAYQQNGNRTDYNYAFAGIGWTDEVYHPKYDIKTSTGNKVNSMYYYSGITDTLVSIDISGLSSTQYMFTNCKALRTIKKLIVSASVSVHANTFTNCTALENITFEGEIGASISFADCPLLTADSVKSIVDHLKIVQDSNSSEFGSYTLTLKTEAWNNFNENVDAPYPPLTWENYITNIGWNLALV